MKIISLLLAIAFSAASSIPADGQESSVQAFIRNSGFLLPPTENARVVESMQMNATLLTPLNSELSMPGDEVRAVVSEDNDPAVTQLIPPGTILRGCVEKSRTSARMSQNGALLLQFYKAESESGCFPVRFAAYSAITPLCQKLPTRSRKHRTRDLLMFSSRLAIPLALGTGGTSLAITTGAGAVIGAAFADDGKYLSGALRGAWEGAGLSAFDPIVRKGYALALPVGTELGLASLGSIRVPIKQREDKTVLGVQARVMDEKLNRCAIAPLQTVASSNAPDGRNSVISTIARYYGERNLAQALDEAAKAVENYPDDSELRQVRDSLFRFANGGEGQSTLDQMMAAYAGSSEPRSIGSSDD